MCRQLLNFLERGGRLPRRQSANGKNRSMETTISNVVSDALRAADKSDVTLLALLNLSASFDSVDHGIMIDAYKPRLKSVLQWINTFIHGGTQTILEGNSRLVQRSTAACH